MSNQLILGLVGLFGSVAIIAGVLVSMALQWSEPGRRRIRQLAPAGAAAGALAPSLSGSADDGAVWEKLARVVPKSPKDMGRLRRRLATAGYRSLRAAVIYSIAAFICPLALGGLGLGVFGLTREGWIAGAFGAAVGYLLPGLYIERKIALRRKEIRNALPDVLDLLIVCLDAGSSLDQAVVKASEELAITYPAMADEMRTLNVETRAGKPRLEAFKNLAQRTKVDDVRAMVAMLVQTDRFGTSVSQALRTFADSLRTKRRQRAEEAAAKLPVKLVFPLVFCLFPAFYVVTLGPAIIQFVRVFFGQVMTGMK